MVKFGGETQDGKGRLIGIALSRRNCEKLLEGQPITFDLAELGLRVVPIRGEPRLPRIGQVLIVAGETEQAILDELQGVAHGAGVDIRSLGPDGEPT